MKLGTDLTNFVQHGQISASAIPALNAAVVTLGTVLEQSLGITATTPTTPGPGQQPAGPHAGGLPPGQARKLGHGHHDH
jgi:hypothetical protein